MTHLPICFRSFDLRPAAVLKEWEERDEGVWEIRQERILSLGSHCTHHHIPATDPFRPF